MYLRMEDTGLDIILSVHIGILVEKWIELYQDHFDPLNDVMWSMRYYEYDELYRQSGPVFIKIGGEHEIAPSLIGPSSLVYELAEVYGAMIYHTEHRYYGKSHPVPDTSVENLKYLSIPQTLADIASFITIKKKELNNTNAFTMVFGCSYSGNLAAWMRVAYPDLVQAALAGSAPIYVKADFYEFYEFVEHSIRKFDENCAINIKETFSMVDELLDSSAINSTKLENDFRLYKPEFSQPSEISYMMLKLANIFARAVSYNEVDANGKTSIENLCISMSGNETISSYHGLAEVFKKKYSTNSLRMSMNYKFFILINRITSWESKSTNGRIWLYQTCTELGYFKPLSSSASIFGYRVPLQYFMDECKYIFGPDFNRDNLNHNIREIDCLYNSKLRNITNIIFMNGDLDPWRSLSVQSDLNEDSPAILIDGAAHCEFMKRNQLSKKMSFIVAKCKIFFMIHQWLYDWLK